MAITTSPDNIPSPTSGDPYNYVVDMAALADRIQKIFTANMTWAGANRPAFMAGRSSDVTKSGTSSISAFVFDTIQLNNGGHYNTANGRFTAPVSGLYTFTVSTTQITTASGPELHAYKNGALYVSNLAVGYYTAYRTFGGTVVVWLDAGDYFDIRWVNNLNSTVTLDGSRSNFSGHYLG